MTQKELDYFREQVLNVSVQEPIEKDDKKKLYIIGNGFDLYHGLPTSYKCFNCFMCREHPDDHERIGRIFDSKDINMLWSDFENKLGELDISGLVCRNLSSWINTKEYEFENEFDELHNDLTTCFQKWVGQIDVCYAKSKRLELDKTARFISFNYTNTLKALYQIPENQIYYIHGNLSDNPYLSPIFGHGKSNGGILKAIADKYVEIKNRIIEEKRIPNWEDSIGDFGEKIASEIFEFLKGLRKESTQNIKNQEEYFDKYVSLDEIYVLGHSLAEVDLPYFEKIACNSRDAKWYVSYFDDLKTIAENVCKIPNIKQVKFISLDELAIKE